MPLIVFKHTALAVLAELNVPLLDLSFGNKKEISHPWFAVTVGSSTAPKRKVPAEQGQASASASRRSATGSLHPTTCAPQSTSRTCKRERRASHGRYRCVAPGTAPRRIPKRVFLTFFKPEGHLVRLTMNLYASEAWLRVLFTSGTTLHCSRPCHSIFFQVCISNFFHDSCGGAAQCVLSCGAAVPGTMFLLPSGGDHTCEAWLHSLPR